MCVSGLNDHIYSGDFSGFANEEAVNLKITQVSVKILRLLDVFSALKATSNSFSLVNRLPPEILLRIFRWCTYRHVLSDPYREHAYYEAPRWLSFSQVCSRWRRLALADPSLWTHIHPSKTQLTKMMTERSVSIPASVLVMTPFP